MADGIAELRTRLDRLEATEACRCTFHEYLHYLDAGLHDELLQVFAPEGRLEVMNFPPNSGEDLRFNGRSEIATLYAGVTMATTRHYSANVSVNVNADASRADLSAYFLAVMTYGLMGGIYELTLAPVENRWRIESMRISSTTGWMIQQEAPPFLANPLAAGTLRGGRPAVVGAPSSRS
ncbi:MAG: nuclear transport factor 2 family protein [Deltaproteobacteria bacterium]|nr:nuclear transport factor 2 family protein [Deltaproteobacteria bacterium]MBW2397924.1 nuclear transport factor 2 family protein [Deltaproteobacteria bacterium]